MASSTAYASVIPSLDLAKELLEDAMKTKEENIRLKKELEEMKAEIARLKETKERCEGPQDDSESIAETLADEDKPIKVSKKEEMFYSHPTSKDYSLMEVLRFFKDLDVIHHHIRSKGVVVKAKYLEETGMLHDMENQHIMYKSVGDFMTKKRKELDMSVMYDKGKCELYRGGAFIRRV